MKITLADIAQRANVSKMTVSRVLNGKGHVSPDTAERIKSIIDKIGYQPNLIARSLASNQSMMLGVIIPKIEHMFLDNYIAQILSGVTDVALRNDYKIVLCPVEMIHNTDSVYLNIARTKILDGMILVKTKIDDPNIDVLADAGFPFVLVNYRNDSEKIHFVDSQNIKGAKMAMEYLYMSGHRDIAFIAGSMDETNARDRMEGFNEAINEYGLSCPDEWIIYGDFDKEKAANESLKLFEKNRIPTAIFCSDDYMAIGVMQTIKEKNLRIPEDIAVIGFDDIELAAYVRPALTTIRQPIYELGKTSAEILLDIVQGKTDVPTHKTLSVELIKRESA